LAAFVLDGDAWYDLAAPEKEKHGLGEHPACELEVRDLNADGRTEILVWGHAETNTDLLHIFVWDGTGYALLAFCLLRGGGRRAAGEQRRRPER